MQTGVKGSEESQPFVLCQWLCPAEDGAKNTVKNSSSEGAGGARAGAGLGSRLRQSSQMALAQQVFKTAVRQNFVGSTIPLPPSQPCPFHYRPGLTAASDCSPLQEPQRKESAGQRRGCRVLGSSPPLRNLPLSMRTGSWQPQRQCGAGPGDRQSPCLDGVSQGCGDNSNNQSPGGLGPGGLLRLPLAKGLCY